MKKSADTKKILQQLKTLNELMENFIRSTLEQNDSGDEQQINLSVNETAAKRKKCWEINQCDQQDCQCRTGEEYRCWLIRGKLQKGCCQGSFARKYSKCYTCSVFKQFFDTPLNALYENFIILTSHFTDQIKEERELAIKDGLTGLYNRKFLNMIKQEDMLSLNDKSFRLSVIIFDLDMLKGINDTYGHLAGDKMIKELSLFLNRYKREGDLLFRLGGDEFLLLLSGVDESRRILTERRLAGLIDEWNKKRKNKIPLPLSFSLGGATGFWGKDFNKMISEADKRMYAHKLSKHRKIKPI